MTRKSADRPHKDLHYFNLGPWPFYVGFTTSEAAFAAEMKRLKIGQEVAYLGRERANATTHFFNGTDMVCAIIAAPAFNARKHSREQYAALVAHETAHVVQEMRNELNNGEHLGNEAEAYLAQQIVQECLQIAWNSGKRRSTEPRA